MFRYLLNYDFPEVSVPLIGQKKTTPADKTASAVSQNLHGYFFQKSELAFMTNPKKSLA
jgi:hypothetical protein